MNATHKQSQRALRSTRRAGLTLIELVVVMTILIALAGLLIPMLPGMLTRAHTSTCSTNIGEVAKSIQEYNMLYGAYPNNMDALSDGKTLINYLANGAALPASQGGPGTNQGAGQVTGISPTAAELAALQAAGISTVQSMVAAYPGAGTTFDPTFNYYSDYANAGTATANALTISTSTVLGGLDPTANTNALAIVNHLGLSATGRYVVLGIGTRCNMVGKTMLAAPVHYGDVPVLNPEYGYERLCGIFKVSDTAATVVEAQLVGVGPIHDDGLGSIGDEVQNWYQISN